MAKRKVGQQTIKLESAPYIISSYSIVGPKEGSGPLLKYFDSIVQDDYFGEESWEKAESKMMIEAIKYSIKNSNLGIENIDFLLAGDLLNQLISSNFAARALQIPFFGLYGACSTMAESLSLGSVLIDGGYADKVVCSTSSHFSSAERQYRSPLEQGGQRPLYSQWTVTGAGATVLSDIGEGPRITYITTGKVMDFGIKDANNMGAAMAPAAADTIIAHLNDTGRQATYYDLIITGDLAKVGMDITIELVKTKGYNIESVYNDCGSIIFDNKKQDTHSGGSGCGCSAVVLNGYLLKEMKKRTFNKILFVGTGALLSPISSFQGESIPCIAHAVSIENDLRV